MLEKISIHGPATFADEVVLDDLREVNFIYGANGSGKTTISNILMNSSVSAGVSLKWKGDVATTSLVYNKTFRDQNFARGVIPGVFTLGKATVDQLAQIEELKTKLSDVRERGLKKSETLKKMKEDQKNGRDNFNFEIWKAARKKHEKVFNEAFKGSVKSMDAFGEKVLSESDTNAAELVDYDTLVRDSQALLTQMPVLLNALPDFPEVMLEDIEGASLWRKIIVGSTDLPISKLIQHFNMSYWIREGKDYLEADSDVCPFCQQHTIGASFREQLDMFFDDEYINSIGRLSELIGEYQYATELVLGYINSLIESESSNSNTQLDISLLKSQYDAFSLLVKNNLELMSSKRKEPSRKLELSLTSSAVGDIKKHIEEANKRICEHNSRVRNYNEERSCLISRIWKYVVSENLVAIDAYKKKDKGLKQGIDNLDAEVKRLRTDYQTFKSQLENANKNVTNVQSSIDEINNSLHAYGFTNFTIVPYDDHYYRVCRSTGEDVNNTLSEGEVTFLTFLYYMQLVKGGFTPEEASNDRILVIDDPISSLDNTILFVVSSMIKELLKQVRSRATNVKQVFILTHNIYFHKEITYVDNGRHYGNETSFWILRKKHNKSYIKCYGSQNPIRGSYELLWDELKSDRDHSIMTIQNTMRKIYETYFRFLGHYNDDEVLSGFQDIHEKEICRSLLCWVNDGSHCVQDDYFAMPEEELVDKYMDIFRRIFIVTNHEGHYKMMMGVKAIDC